MTSCSPTSGRTGAGSRARRQPLGGGPARIPASPPGREHEGRLREVVRREGHRQHPIHERHLRRRAWTPSPTTATSTMCVGTDRTTSPTSPIYDQDKKRRIVIEYFGLHGDPDYDAWLRKSGRSGPAVTRSSWSTSPTDVARPDFEEKLLADLRAASGRRCGNSVTRSSGTGSRSAPSTGSLKPRPPSSGEPDSAAGQVTDLRQEWSRHGLRGPDLDRFIELGATSSTPTRRAWPSTGRRTSPG